MSQINTPYLRQTLYHRHIPHTTDNTLYYRQKQTPFTKTNTSLHKHSTPHINIPYHRQISYSTDKYPVPLPLILCP